MEKEYLSIKDFAAAAGVSQQAIYKQLNNKLKNYLKVVDDKKMLEKSALSLFKKKDESTDTQQQLLKMLQTELNEKSQQLNEKDKQIAELQKLLDQAQKLHAMEKQRVLELEDKMAAADQEHNKESEEPQKKSFFSRLFGK